MQNGRDKFSKERLILYIFGAAIAIWAAFIMAPGLEGGLKGLIKNFPEAMARPLHIVICEGTFKTVVIMLVIYGIALGVYLSSDRNYRKRQEHGSAKWGSPSKISRKYSDREEPSKNKILTRNVAIGLDGRKHMRNLNVLVCGGSGSGKTRFYAKPNIMNCNTSFVVTDPKGEILRDTGNMLLRKGYDIKVIDLINMERSHCYNPFVYIRDDNDIQTLVTSLFKNTTPKGTQTQDPFWDNAAMMLLKACICYLWHKAPPEEQNFPMVMEMVRAGDIDEDHPDRPSALDTLFEKLASDSGSNGEEHIALKYYRDYRKGAGRTIKSIQITLLSRLEKFNMESLSSITQTDELDLEGMGERKMALFAVIPDNDSSYNFVIGMLYTQLFQRLKAQADFRYGVRLPVHVHFVMDEFANVALPEEFDKDLSTIRSREISVSIIIQNMAQLKALFEKQWESIVGNCDEFLYLGGNEQSTHEYISKLLGKETIDLNTYGRSKGHSGSYSTNWQITGRELLDPSEVRMLDNSNALLFIRGESPVMDGKYDILKHPNIALTTDGGAAPFIHGYDHISLAAIDVDKDAVALSKAETVDEDEYLFFSEDELEELLEKKKEKIKEKKQNG